jgi:hypothetical protein
LEARRSSLTAAVQAARVVQAASVAREVQADITKMPWGFCETH